MVHQLPTGAKDLLPLDVAQKSWIENRIQQVFQSWGYHRIITPTVEHLRSLTAGGAVDPESVIQLHSNSIDILGLRPELTASIARAYAARLGDQANPQRLYYNANVFRRKPNNSSEESFQAGVELLGASGVIADAEILMLLGDSLEQIQLENWQIILGDARLTGALLELLPEQYRSRVRQCLASLDRVGLIEMDLPADVKSYALEIIDLRGTPKTVLSRLSGMAWAAPLKGEINYLKSLIELWESYVQRDQTEVSDRLILDLSLVQTFDYYTGIVFEVACHNYVIAQGGRYDRLLGIYHPQGQSYPSIGFCLNIEELQQALVKQLPQALVLPQCLVVAQSAAAVAAAFAYAAKLRQSHLDKSTTPHQGAIEMELELRDATQIKAYARSRGFAQIAWISEKNIEVESL
ncbi:MAG: ATP phosphoribosyltransferase regulatory subunit [Pseudanabaenaceae cyanobacterium bins.39]|nr:ATP phosphoribosyltransferase regulatory subunit [Pseudanabaenaceae cyanobacterium bins.39]